MKFDVEDIVLGGMLQAGHTRLPVTFGQVSSLTFIVPAFCRTDAIPFSAVSFVAYRSDVAIFSLAGELECSSNRYCPSAVRFSS